MGVAPERSIWLTHEIIANDGTMISSPTPYPKAWITNSIAAVPFVTDTPCLRLQNRAKLDSKFATTGPSPEIHPSRSA